LVYLAQYMLNPLTEHEFTKYNRDFFYEAKLEIAKITSPYIYKQNFSYVPVKRDF